jgi:hypothetical protein
MPFDWNNFLVLAEELATKPDEASKRTAISRAYYCVFNIAFARAEHTAGPSPGSEPFHTWCWNKYDNTPDHSCKQIAADGQRMKRRRVRADYKPADIHRIDDEVRRMLQEARQLRTDLAKLNPRYPLP